MNPLRIIVEITTGVIMCFIGLFIIAMVSGVIPLPQTSPFYSSYTGLQSFTGIFFTILGLVIVLHGLSAAIHTLSGQGDSQQQPGPGPGGRGGFG